MIEYRCGECNLGVIVLPEGPIKACVCDAPITASISATATGQSGMAVQMAGFKNIKAYVDAELAGQTSLYTWRKSPHRLPFLVSGSTYL